MDSLDDIKVALAKALPGLQARYHVDRLSIFGSWVHGEQKPGSDVDLLVDFDPAARVGFLFSIALEDELRVLLGRKVDLVTRGALKPRIGRRVLTELVTV